VLGGDDRPAFAGQKAGARAAHRCIVVDDEHPTEMSFSAAAHHR